MIPPFRKMTKPNEPLIIHKGQFELITKKSTCTVAGRIQLNWFPKPIVSFEGEVHNNFTQLLHGWLNDVNFSCTLRFKSYIPIDCIITSLGTNDLQDMVGVVMQDGPVFGDK